LINWCLTPHVSSTRMACGTGKWGQLFPFCRNVAFKSAFEEPMHGHHSFGFYCWSGASMRVSTFTLNCLSERTRLK
jgi:hypothetical protein